MNVREQYDRLVDLGITYKRQGRYNDALDVYGDALKICNTDPALYYNIAKVFYLADLYKDSAWAYTKAYQLGVLDVGLDATTLCIHLGHALNDSKGINTESKNVVMNYKQSLNPQVSIRYVRPTQGDVDRYDGVCFEIGKKHLMSHS